MNALLEPHVAEVRKNVESLRNLKNKMRAEQSKANRIKGKAKLSPKDQQKLAGIKRIVSQHLANAEREASDADQSFSAISAVLESHHISLTAAERRTIFKLKLWKREHILMCKAIYASL